MKNSTKLLIGINSLLILSIILISYLYKNNERNKYEEEMISKIDSFFEKQNLIQDGKFEINNEEDGDFYIVHNIKDSIVINNRIIRKSNLDNENINLIYNPYLNSFNVRRIRRAGTLSVKIIEFNSGFLGFKNKGIHIDKAYRGVYNQLMSADSLYNIKGSYESIKNLLDSYNKYYYFKKDIDYLKNENISNQFNYDDFVIEFGFTDIYYSLTLDEEEWYYELFTTIMIGIIFQLILNLGVYLFNKLK